MLCPTLPWPLTTGSKIRIYFTLRELARAHTVTLVAFTHSKLDIQHAAALTRLAPDIRLVRGYKPRLLAAAWAVVSSRPYRAVKLQSAHCRQTVEDVLNEHRYDIIWAHGLEMAEYVPENTDALVVLDQHNADELVWERYAMEGSWAISVFARRELAKVQRFQFEVLRKVAVLVCVSASEAEFMRSRVPQGCEVWVVPNGVDVHSFQPAKRYKPGNVVVLCGAMDILMNVDAAVRFTKHIFPMIRDEVHDAEFWIVGRNPALPVRRLASLPGVRVTGSVPDVRSFYQQAKVAVAPFRYGGGTKLKVLEAMAMGVPVVSTPTGCQGLEVVPGEHILVEDTDNRFAERVIELLQNEGMRAKLASQARGLVEEKYEWGKVFRGLISRLERIKS